MIKKISIQLSLLLYGIATNSQPLPPIKPEGNPVPVNPTMMETITVLMLSFDNLICTLWTKYLS